MKQTKTEAALSRNFPQPARAKNQREISSDAGLDTMADFFESTLSGIRIAAKAGKSRRSLRNMAAFASRAYIVSDCRTAADRRASRRLSIRPSDYRSLH